MKYVVSRDLIQQFVMMNIDAMDLFPDDAPSGASFYELIPENGEPVVITYEDAINAIKLYKERVIDFEKLSTWIDAVIALDLFKFDDSSDDSLNKSAGIVYSLDEEKEGRDELNFDRLDEIISRCNL